MAIRYEGFRREDGCLVVWWDDRSVWQRDLTPDSTAVGGDGELYLPAHGLSATDQLVVRDPIDWGIPADLATGIAYGVKVLDADHLVLLDPVHRRPVTIRERINHALTLQRVRVLDSGRNIARAIEPEWGYPGFNPTQLAHDLLLQTMTLTGMDKARYQLARSLATEFMTEQVSQLPHPGWVLEQSAIEGWLEERVVISLDFTASKTRIQQGDTVEFQALVNGYNVDYTWDFGDGGTSTESNPSYTFDRLNDAFCSVTLTVRNGAKYAIRRKADYIRIGDPPTAPDVLARVTT